MVDWGSGHYEKTAAELAPVAEHVVSLAALQPGERIVDLATGTGNAALLAARTGASVTGLDASPRLLDVARARATEAGLEASFVLGDLGALPFENESFDVALSVFGLIFADHPETAFAEMVRVLDEDGRALVAVWVPAGPIDGMVGVFGRAVGAVSGQVRARFAWSDPEVVGKLAARHGASIRLHEGVLSITAGSAEAYLAETERSHPMSLAMRPLLERAGTYREVREEALTILREGNEDPAAFRVSSPYRIIEISAPPRHGAAFSGGPDT